MQDSSQAVDAYLLSRFGTDLESVLLAATGGGLDATLAEAITLACDPVGAFAYEDGGLCELYQGLLTIEGVSYRFRCTLFLDAGGARFIEEIGELEPVRWGVRLVVPRRAGVAAGGT